MTWFTLSLVSAFMWAIAIAVDKLVLVRWQVTPALMCFLAALVELAAAGGVWVTLGLSEMPYPAIALALCAGMFKTLFYLFYYLAVTREEVSRIATLDSLTPLVILLSAGFVLNEALQPQEHLGVILVVSGAGTDNVQRQAVPAIESGFLFCVSRCSLYYRESNHYQTPVGNHRLLDRFRNSESGRLLRGLTAVAESCFQPESLSLRTQVVCAGAHRRKQHDSSERAFYFYDRGFTGVGDTGQCVGFGPFDIFTVDRGGGWHRESGAAARGVEKIRTGAKTDRDSTNGQRDGCDKRCKFELTGNG